ncbi:MAG: hypothetical protein QOG13_2217 [Sphingomonadales bacterium]|jgi:hypothetical protein|nr:hypothetical protein [Sphingomonadales bacterium]
MAARFEGVPVVEFLPDGRNIELKSELTFYDSEEIRWSVPPKAVVDGASIPSAFWSLIGSPLTGRYRDASIIHDWFCDQRTRTWEATHRVFYEAMIVSGVTLARAKLMYFAVRWAGPRWEERVSINTNLDVGERYRFEEIGANVSPPRTRRKIGVQSPGEVMSEDGQRRVAEAVAAHMENEEPSIERIEELAELPSPLVS